MRKCQFCNKEFEPNKNGARYKYCSEECYKEERRKRNRERWRRQHPDWNKKVVKKCEWCGDEYSVPKRNAHQARFCSDKCRRNYRKERRIKRNPDLNKEVIKKCEWCGGEYIALKINAHQARFCSDNCRQTYYSRVVKGHESWEEWKARVAKQKQERLAKLEKEKAIRTLRNSLIRVIKHKEEQERIKRLTRECEECGTMFYNPHPNAFTCSSECSRKRDKRLYRYRRRKRINKHNLVDKDISLKRLYKRDKGICYLCGEPCDFNDKVVTDEGYFIVGETYPTIEHIIPISKGGKHSWDNVKLAHHRCNTLKRDKIIQENVGID